MWILRSEASVAEGVAELCRVEPRFAIIVAAHGHPPLRRVAEGMPSLLRIVTDQLISLKAGEAIWRRLEAALSPFVPDALVEQPEEALMALGLSRAKARCFRNIALAVIEQRLDFTALSTMPDDAAACSLTAIPGIGPWTAEIYLLTAMGRADVWPVGDVALQAAAQHLFILPERPNNRQMLALGEPFRPWRAVAARLLWSHYRGLKGLTQSVD